MVRIDGAVNGETLRLVIASKSARVMGLPAAHAWIAAVFTDMRAGFNGLTSKVESALADDPFSGHVFVF